jgi:hypothetical protein
MPIKAAELHALARKILGARMEELAFRRVPRTTVAAWMRPEGDRWLMLWFQPDRWNGPDSAGFKFTSELRLADRDVLYAAGPRARLPALMPEAEREHLRQMENRAIAKLPPPDRAALRALPEAVRQSLLADRAPRLQPYRAGEDVWFRCADHDDLRATLELIARVLPPAIDLFLDAHRGARSAIPEGASAKPETKAP